MRQLSAVAIACFIGLLAGCRTGEFVEVTPSTTYQENWSLLREGMTQQEVLDAIGEPASRVGADGPNQRWHYGTFRIVENLFSPADQAYVVWFDHSGKVQTYRKPLAVENDRSNGDKERR